MRGLTLVELLIVLSILGVMTSIAVPNLLSYLPKYHLNGAARDLTTDLNYARMRAAAGNVEYRLLFSIGSESYEIQQGDSSLGSTSWAIDGPARAFADPGNSHYHQGIDIVSVSSSGELVLFRPTGTATASTIRLGNVKGETVDIDVSIAGRIHAQ